MSVESLSVSELNLLIKDVLNAGFPRALWVCGEIQNLDRYKSKTHLYFELVEKDPGAKDVKAKIPVAIWAGVRPKIEAILKKAENAFDLKDGIEVRLSGRIDHYVPYGKTSFIVDNIDPVHTLGKIAQERQKLIAELTKSGILGKNKTLTLSDVPLNIGLITAFDSAAYNDFFDELKQSGYAFRVHLARAVMQGKNCEPSVCTALQQLNAVDNLQAIVITRGGGSIAELACFDSKPIALAVAASRYPVLTGIGHEINSTITDLAAHTFSKTPTAIARVLIEKVRGFIDKLDIYSRDLQDSLQTTFEAKQSDLKNTALELQTLTQSYLKDHDHGLTQRSEIIRRASLKLLTGSREDLTRSQLELSKTIHLRFDKAHAKISAYEKMVEFASPRKILKRGFSVTRDIHGRALRSADMVRPGDRLLTELMDGVLVSIADKKKTENIEN